MGQLQSLFGGILLLMRGDLELANAPTNPCYHHIDAAYDRFMYYQLSNPFCLCPGQQASAKRIYKTSANYREYLPALDQFSSVPQSCLTLCNPMNSSTPGLPVHHHLPEFTQTHIHRARDAIQPSHPLLSPSPSALNLSQHQSLFQ